MRAINAPVLINPVVKKFRVYSLSLVVSMYRFAYVRMYMCMYVCVCVAAAMPSARYHCTIVPFKLIRIQNEMIKSLNDHSYDLAVS